MFIKTGTKNASKGGIELAILKAFWEVLIEELSFGFGFGVAELVLVHLLAVLLVDGFSLVHTVVAALQGSAAARSWGKRGRGPRGFYPLPWFGLGRSEVSGPQEPVAAAEELLAVALHR